MQAILPLTSARLPERLLASAWLEHGAFAFWIVDTLRPRLIVELGSHNGYSFCCFCQQMERSKIDGRAVAVDTWEGDEHAGNYNDEIYQKLSNYVSSRYGDLAELKRSHFSEALSSIADGSVDLLHVDGRHFYDDVVEDFTSWVPKLSDRAVVLFHDTQVQERNFGVHRYWAELERQYPTFEFHHGHGLGVLGFGKRLPREIKALFEERDHPPLAAATRAAFAKRGRRIANIWRLQAVVSNPKLLLRKITSAVKCRTALYGV